MFIIMLVTLLFSVFIFASYIIEDGVCYLTLCEKSYPPRLAFTYLEAIHQAFSDQHGQEIYKASRPYHFIEFGMI